MNSQNAAERVLDMLHAIERRDFVRVREIYHPDVEFHWPPGLPYSGVFKGGAVDTMGKTFAETWIPLQPDEQTRRMDPQVIATAGEDRVVVNYVWKGMARSGGRFETETLADYWLRDGRLIRARMFYYDLPGMISFLQMARNGSP